jgi:hypothetical protein
MHEPLYRQALRNGWRFAWHHKLLWGMGLFASALGYAGFLDFFVHSVGATTSGTIVMNWTDLVRTCLALLGFIVRLPSADVLVWSVWLLVIFAGFGLLFFAMAVISQGAIVHAAAQSMGRLNTGTVHVDRAWHAGVKHMWPLIVIHGFKKFSLTVLGLFLGWASFSAVFAPSLVDVLLFWFLFIAVIIVGTILSFLAIYATGYVVVEEYSLLDAIDAAWRIFTAHWFVSIEIGLFLLCTEILAGLVAVAGIVFFFFPSLLVWALALVSGSSALFTAGTLFGIIAVIACFCFVAALYTLLVTYVWTYAFVHMHHKGIASRFLAWWK